MVTTNNQIQLRVHLHVFFAVILAKVNNFCGFLGPVVQSIVSLTSSLRGQLVKCFTTLYLNTLIFFAEKMREAFAVEKLLTLFQQKILANSRYQRLKI